MPSLLGTQVTANYGRMLPQDTYGTGAEFSNFGTRPMRLLKITATSVTNGSFVLQDGSTADASLSASQGFVPSLVGWKQPNSLFSRLVRTVQTFGEIYMVGAPDATNFQVLVSADTVNDAASGNTASTAYTLLEAALAAEVAATNVAATGLTNSSSATITVTASGTAANKNIFVGAALATQA